MSMGNRGASANPSPISGSKMTRLTTLNTDDPAHLQVRAGPFDYQMTKRDAGFTEEEFKRLVSGCEP